MQHRPLGKTGLSIAPLVFGGNVFGWTIDEAASFKVLDAFVDHGFNAIDTADLYSAWVPGNQGGESETIIGRWLKARPGMRDKVVIFTKVGADLRREGKTGLSRRRVLEAVEESLARLGIEVIDLYFSHRPDAGTPHAETLAAYDTLIAAGKVRAIGASNYDAGQLRAALDVAAAEGLPAYQVLQPKYNLYDRGLYDGPLRDLCLAGGLGVVPYHSLASGFLSGKYRSEDDLAGSQRGARVAPYLNASGAAALRALEEVATRHEATPAEIALAWLMAREGVTAPIASATSIRQVESFARATEVRLSAEDLAVLDLRA